MAKTKYETAQAPEYDEAQNVSYDEGADPDFDEAAQADYADHFADGDGDDGGSQEWRFEPEFRAAPPRK